MCILVLIYIVIYSYWNSYWIVSIEINSFVVDKACRTLALRATIQTHKWRKTKGEGKEHIVREILIQ